MTSRGNTIQKDLVRNAVYEMRRHVTANEVYKFIKEAYHTIGKETVDMDQIPDLLERIHNTHGIEFVDYDISFKGICPKCREKIKEEKYGLESNV